MLKIVLIKISPFGRNDINRVATDSLNGSEFLIRFRVKLFRVPGQALPGNLFKKRLRVKLFDVKYTLAPPDPFHHHHSPGHGRNARGIRHGLGVQFAVSA